MIMAGSGGLKAVIAMFNTLIHPVFGSGSDKITHQACFYNSEPYDTNNPNYKSIRMA